MVRLSQYPAEKVELSCAKCAIRVRYDRDACLAAGGDRDSRDFLNSVAQRHGCKGHYPFIYQRVDVIHRCAMEFVGMFDLMMAKHGLKREKHRR